MKGNSERVVNKNLKDFCGKPLYHSIVSSLVVCDYIHKIVINTDSDKIKEDVSKFFPEIIIIDRPSEIQGDYVSMNKIIHYDLSIIDGEHFIQTHSTNPLLSSRTIDKAIKCYFDQIDSYDSLFTVTRLQTRLYDEHKKPVNHNPKTLERTQDLEPLFEENSNLYIFSKSSFYKAGSERIGLNSTFFETEKIESIDIDTNEDFFIAESLKMRSK